MRGDFFDQISTPWSGFFDQKFTGEKGNGFFDWEDCGSLFRKIKDVFFIHLPKFNIKVFILSKNGINENCLKYTHFDFINVKRSKNNCNIIENEIKNLNLDIIVENEHRYNNKFKFYFFMDNLNKIMLNK